MTFPSLRLGDLVDIVVGKTPSRSEGKYWSGVHPWLAIGDMKQGRLITSTRELISDEAVVATKPRLIPAGSPLLSFKLSIGKTALTEIPLYTNEAIAALLVRSPERLDPNYLLRALDFIDLASGSNRAAMGSTLNRPQLEAIRIPLPPLPEQRRIAAILDQVDALRLERRSSRSGLPMLKRALFDETFSKNQVIANQRLGDVLMTSSGGTPSRAVSAHFNGDIPWVKSGEVAGGIIRSTQELITELGLAASPAKVKHAGTVLVAMYGATAGEVGQLGIDAAMNQAVCAIEPGSRFRTSYLVSFFESKRAELKGMAVGGAQPNLSQSQIRGLRLPVPDLDLQIEFETQIRQVEALERSSDAHLAKLDELFASLQHRAFNGEL